MSVILAKKIAFEQEVRNIDISKATGLHESTVSKIMTGTEKPYPKAAKAIADFLGYDGDIKKLFAKEGCCPLCGKPY